MRFDLHHWRHWWAVHLRWWWQDARTLLRRSIAEFGEDHCTQLAASISYYVLFSIFPLAILAVAVSGLVLTDASLRQDVIDELFNALPLSEDEGRRDLERAVNGVATGLSAIGLISIFGLLWSASGMMGALRHALNQAWDTDHRRPFLRAKGIDFLMVAAVGALLSLSIGSTFFLQVARRVSGDISDSLGPVGEGATLAFEVVAVLVPLLFTFSTFMLIFKFIPNVHTRFRYIWPGALVAAVLFEIVKNGFAIYLSNFGNYDAVYGSLGAVVAFLFFVFISANIVLFGAEVAAEWPRVIHGYYDADLARAGRNASWWRRGLSASVGLVRSAEPLPDHISNPADRQARGQRRVDEIQRRLNGAQRAAGTPDSDAPDSDAPDSDAPDSDAPDSDAPDSDAPDSDAPDTATSDTATSDADAPEDDVGTTDPRPHSGTR